MSTNRWLLRMILALISVAFLACGASTTTPDDTEGPPLLDLSGDYFGQELPGRTPTVFAPGIISGQSLHATPTFSPDGNEVYWAVGGGGPGLSRIWFSRRIDGQWTQPALAPFAETEHGDNPVISPDGESLFFNSIRALNGEEKERIWYVERESAYAWSNPVPVPSVINNHPLHWQTSLERGRNLYFSSSGDPNYGSDDLFVSEYRNGGYREPVNLGGFVNSAASESMPFIDPDGRFLIFSRQSGQQPGEIFVSQRVFGGSWETPINVTDANRDLRGECPQLTPDGEYLFFLKYDAGVFNVYWVDADVLYEIIGF